MVGHREYSLHQSLHRLIDLCVKIPILFPFLILIASILYGGTVLLIFGFLPKEVAVRAPLLVISVLIFMIIILNVIIRFYINILRNFYQLSFGRMIVRSQITCLMWTITILGWGLFLPLYNIVKNIPWLNALQILCLILMSSATLIIQISMWLGVTSSVTFRHLSRIATDTRDPSVIEPLIKELEKEERILKSVLNNYDEQQLQLLKTHVVSLQERLKTGSRIPFYSSLIVAVISIIFKDPILQTPFLLGCELPLMILLFWKMHDFFSERIGYLTFLKEHVERFIDSQGDGKEQ